MSDEAWEQQLKDFRSTAYTYVYNLAAACPVNTASV